MTTANRLHYRAWDKVNNVMCSVWAIRWKAWDEENELNYITVHAGDGIYDLLEHEVELIQSTGLTDCHGKEIFDGDVVRFTEEGYEVSKCVNGEWIEYRRDTGVIFWEQGWAGNPNGSAQYNCTVIGGGTNQPTWWMSSSKEIIGNIHESPELLEKK